MHVVTESTHGAAPCTPQRLQHRVRRADRILRRRCLTTDAHRGCGDRAEFFGFGGTLAHPARSCTQHFPAGVGAALDPVRRSRFAFDLATGQERDSFPAGCRQEAVDGPQSGQRLRADSAAPRMRSKRCAPTGITRSAQYRWKHPIGRSNSARQRLAAVPDAGLPPVGPQRLLPVGRRIRFPRSAAGRDGAGPSPSRRWCASTCCAARRASSSKATCSTGGMRRSAAACAPAAPTTCCGCPCAVCRYVACTGDTGVLDETVAFLDGRRLRAERGAYYDLPGTSEERRSLYEHCVRAIDTGLRRRARPAADGQRRLERRHEPRRAVRASGESVWLGFFLYDVLDAIRAAVPTRAAIARFADRCQHEARRSCGEHRAARLGRRVVSARLFRRRHAAGLGRERRNAGSTRSRRAGRCCPARAPPSAPRARWTRSTGTWSAATRLIQLLTRHSTSRTLNPGYIKGYVPGVRENGGQYTHAAVWAVMAFAAAGRRRTRPGSCSRCSTPCNHARTPAGGRDLQGRALRAGGRRLCASRRTPAAAAGPGTPARRAGCTG